MNDFHGERRIWQSTALANRTATATLLAQTHADCVTGESVKSKGPEAERSIMVAVNAYTHAIQLTIPTQIPAKVACCQHETCCQRQHWPNVRVPSNLWHLGLHRSARMDFSKHNHGCAGPCTLMRIQFERQCADLLLTANSANGYSSYSQAYGQGIQAAATCC